MRQDPYLVLGVDSKASQDEIGKAFRSLASKYHPDRNPDNAKEAANKFKEVVAAYEIVGDESKRRQYDFYRGTSFPSFSFRSRNGVDDMFDNLFSQFFGGKTKGAQHFRTRVRVSLAEAFRGCSKKISVESLEPCKSCSGTGSSEWLRCEGCGGSGFVFTNEGPMRIQTSCVHCSGMGSISRKPCQSCSGRGQTVKSQSEVEIPIPPGVEDGMQVRVSKDSGDIFVVVNVDKDGSVSRQQSNLVGSIDLPYSALVFGCDAKFNLFGMEISVKVPPRTKAGSRLRIRGQGMPRLQNPEMRGDLFLDVGLLMPDSVGGEYEKILVQLSKFEGRELK